MTMARPNYLPTRHDLLCIAAFLRRIHDHRLAYWGLSPSIPLEIRKRIAKTQIEVNKRIIAIAQEADRQASFELVEIDTGGRLTVEDFHGNRTKLNVGWVNRVKWDSKIPKHISKKKLGYCVLHDASFEITMGINMDWFGGMRGEDEMAVVVWAGSG